MEQIEHPRARDARRLAYEPSLDGMRGLCLLAVLLFHARFSWATGGFLGVSTFFTLSGYLITELLLLDVGAGGALDLRGFWRRRARRLLPASLLLLAALACFAPLYLGREGQERLAADLLASLAYVVNWRFVSGDYAYSLIFSSPSLVQHFWSLAIEGQFYLVFPLVVGLIARARAFERILQGFLAVCVLGLTGLSFGYGADATHWDRIYYGTDTRAGELLLGALLALTLRRRSPGASGTALADGLGIAALAAMVLAWTLVDLESPWLYRGGLSGFAVLSAVLIYACLRGRSGARRLLALPPLVWLGQISYGAYLYHWPIYLMIDAAWPGATPIVRFTVGGVLALLAAAASSAWVETPIRRGRSGIAGRPVLAATAGTAVVLGLICLRLPVASLPAQLGLEPNGSGGASPGAPGHVSVAIYGDSTALTLNRGLRSWARQDPVVRVLQGLTLRGCGLLGPAWVRDLDRRGQDGQAWVSRRGANAGVPQGCMAFVEDLRAAAEDERPELAVVLVGIWEVRGVLDPVTGTTRTLGDAEVDRVMREAIEEIVDLFANVGARTVWLTTPPLTDTRGKIDPAELERARRRLREIALALAVARPDDLRVVDLGGHLEAGDGAAASDPELRPDGVHFTRWGAKRLWRDWLAEELLAAHARDPAARPNSRR